jgi:CheY-like chemotaxis protein
MEAPDAAAGGQPSPRRKRILLADDEEVVRKTVRLVLGFQGYEVVEASDGEDAVERYAAGPPFDLILLDVDMPRTNGLAALARIRERNPDVKVVVLSGTPQKPDVADVAFVQKPFDYHQFLRLIREMLGEPSAPAANVDGSPGTG